MRVMEESCRPKEPIKADKNAKEAAFALATVVLRSSPEVGISHNEVEERKGVFGSNAIANKVPDSFLKLCWEAMQDYIIIMFIFLGVISIVIEATKAKGEGKKCGYFCWIDGAAILVSVLIVCLVIAATKYDTQSDLIRHITRSSNDTHAKLVIRDGQQVNVIDDDIVVGDILSLNAHNLASIPADCVLLGPPPCLELTIDESSLPGGSNRISKKPGDVILSGTTATAIHGHVRMVVIAVGVNSVAGKIKARDESEDQLDEGSPSCDKFTMLTKCAVVIGVAFAIRDALS